MLISIRNGSVIGYQHFIFPDGQRHITLAREVKDSDVQIDISICSADDLFDLLLVKDILDNGCNVVHLRINYLLGGRMDRRIDNCQPWTLKVVTNILNAAGFDSIEVLDPHSDETLRLLRDRYGKKNIRVAYPEAELRPVLRGYKLDDTAIIIPDDGAYERVMAMLLLTGRRDLWAVAIPCHKQRDPQDGRLFNFSIERPGDVDGKRCLILDDICDGGGTFVALAKLLREAGAVSVDLFVTHGVFSKGRELEGIDKVHSTHSFTGKIWPKKRTEQE